MAWQRLWHLPILLLITLVSTGCGSDDPGDDASNPCSHGEQQNALTGECEPRDDGLFDAGDQGADAGSDARGQVDSGDQDSGFDDSGASDAGDTGDDEDSTPPCPDRDGDGADDAACGGLDCDDTNASVGPGMAEICDANDNDCDGALNQGLACTFYAHSQNDMYLVDPFAKTATHVTTVPSLFDMDTHPDGTLYGITSTALYEYDESSGSWAAIGSLGVTGTPNGLAIDNLGTAYMTASNTVYTVDLSSGAATTIGSMGGSYNSSGDCVVNKDNSLYMSSNHNIFGGDNLVLIDGDSGQAEDVGPTGQSGIYGLTAAWGRMFGLTEDGHLIEINSGTGESTLLHTFSGISWYGAASTPQR